MWVEKQKFKGCGVMYEGCQSVDGEESLICVKVRSGHFMLWKAAHENWLKQER
jgi:hypothetical protein